MSSQTLDEYLAKLKKNWLSSRKLRLAGAF